MTADSTQSPPRLPARAFAVQYLVLLGFMVFVVKLFSAPPGLENLLPGLIFVLGALPGTVAFLVAYHYAIHHLRARRPQWGIGQLVGVTTLISLGACIPFILMIGLLLQ